MKTKITCTAIVLLLILLIPAGKILWSRPEPTAPGTTAASVSTYSSVSASPATDQEDGRCGQSALRQLRRPESGRNETCGEERRRRRGCVDGRHDLVARLRRCDGACLYRLQTDRRRVMGRSVGCDFYRCRYGFGSYRRRLGGCGRFHGGRLRANGR